MSTVTVTITPQQAARIMGAISSHGEMMIKFKRSAPRGQQTGGFLPLIASLAAPLVAQGVGALVKKMTGKGHCKACTITASKKQYDKMKAISGAGHKLIVNFKVSKNKKHVLHPTMQGAGWLSMLPGLLMRGVSALSKAVMPSARKIASNVGNSASNLVKSQAVKRIGNVLQEEGEKAVTTLAKKGVQTLGDKAMQRIERIAENDTVKKVAKHAVTKKLSNAVKPEVDQFAANLERLRMQMGKGIHLAGNGLKLAGRPMQTGGAAPKKKFRKVLP